MAIPLFAWGISKDFNSQKAVHQALQQALSQINMAQPSLALFFTGREFHVEAIEEAKSLLGNIPLWGLTTAAPIDEKGEHPGAIMAVVLSGREMQTRVGLWENALENTPDLILSVNNFLKKEKNIAAVLVAGDGNHAHPPELFSEFSTYPFLITGALSSRSADVQKTMQIGNGFSSERALSLVQISGDIHLSVGMGVSWQDVGLNFMVTKAQGNILYSLDDQPAVEIFSQLFGRLNEDWRTSLFSEMIRLYPLGIELFPGSTEIILRSPIRIQTDGSFVMNAQVVEGQNAHLMVGNMEACLEAAQSAARQALQAAGGASPFFSLVFIDVAWRSLFYGDIIRVTRAIEHVLGQVPIVGAYTSGQLFRTSSTSTLQVFNQNILIVLFCHPR